ncbi:MAG: hypothetical protein COB85_09715 [Bacteroidetes bacterium]|nr:MAG: hypothetical protein COB85_09715 [Bacteroidota bacterium]
MLKMKFCRVATKRKVIGLMGLLALTANICFAQPDSTRKKLINRVHLSDSISINQDALYNRPFIGLGRTGTAIGGYIEGNTNYFMEDGVTEGFSMELRRFNIFIFAALGKRVRILSELEFEHGTEEIALETAQIDYELHEVLSFRAGILLPQIGMFNANHDSPKWDFIDRPLSSTMIIPSTLAEVGFGFFGKFYKSNWAFSYDAYLVNGLQADIVVNEEGKTFIPAGKNAEMFEEDNNGQPMVNAKFSMSHNKAGELGLSYYGGVYNNYRIEGEQVDAKRNLSLFALDITTGVDKFKLQGEYVYALIDVPDDLEGLYGQKQWGGWLELNYTLLDKKIVIFDQSQLLFNMRIEKIDFNADEFNDSNGIVKETKLYDEITALSIGLSIRTSSSLVFKAVYQYHWIRDLIGNPAARKAGFQFGLATYF